MKLRFLLCFSAFIAATVCAQTPAPSAAPIRVMVLGAYHFGNPGQDLHNVKVDSVLTPEKQAELSDVATRLAKFEPTKIAVEAVSTEPDFTYRKFGDFTPENGPLLYRHDLFPYGNERFRDGMGSGDVAASGPPMESTASWKRPFPCPGTDSTLETVRSHVARAAGGC